MSAPPFVQNKYPFTVNVIHRERVSGTIRVACTVSVHGVMVSQLSVLVARPADDQRVGVKAHPFDFTSFCPPLHAWRDLSVSRHRPTPSSG